LLLFTSGAALAAAPLRICADPDNLPFSNRHQQGFENRIGALLAKDLGRDAVFIWARSRRGFLREQFNKDACDVLMGVPEGMRGVTTTLPYYRSTYVFVTRSREHLQITSFTDPHLNGRRIGLQILDEDFAPPSLPLIRTGHAAQLVGFNSFGDGNADLVRAVADGRIGAAVIWGPVAGYYTASQRLPLTITPVSPAIDAGVPFVYSLAVGVHRSDNALRDHLNASIARLQSRIDQILASYHVPTVPLAKGSL
jgi:mxaJ protein